MVKPRVDATNWEIYSNEIAEGREAWIEESSKTIVDMMEWKRFRLGVGMDAFYGKYLGCKISPKSLKKVLTGESAVPMKLFLSFCYTYEYDIKKFTAASKLLNEGGTIEDYQKIGSAVEALGEAGINEWVSNFSGTCSTATHSARKKLSIALRKFGKSVESNNEESYSDKAAEGREAWIEESSKTIVDMMEWKRFLFGLSREDFQVGLLGCKINFRTFEKMLRGEAVVPLNLFLSFCFTFGYDLKKVDAVSKLLKDGKATDAYQKIGAAVEATGKTSVYELASNLSDTCPTATGTVRRQLAKALYELGKSMEGIDDITTDKEMVRKVASEVNEEAKAEVKRLEKIRMRKGE